MSFRHSGWKLLFRAVLHGLIDALVGDLPGADEEGRALAQTFASWLLARPETTDDNRNHVAAFFRSIEHGVPGDCEGACEAFSKRQQAEMKDPDVTYPTEVAARPQSL